MNDIFSIPWILSSVIFAFLINLASAYAKPHIDDWIAARSRRRRQKLEKQRSKEAELVNRYAESPALITLASGEAHIYLIASAMGLVMALGLGTSQGELVPPESIVNSPVMLQGWHVGLMIGKFAKGVVTVLATMLTILMIFGAFKSIKFLDLVKDKLISDSSPTSREKNTT